MISPDAPIKHVKDDRLGRAPFARALAKTLLANDADESFVVGVHGKWGTGKSSVLNLCVEELKTQAKDSAQQLDILQFNPWNFADQTQLVLQFFRQLTAHLRKVDPTGKGNIKNLIDSLDAYATTLGPPIEAIPYGKTVWTGWRAGIGMARRALGMGQDVDSLYSSISNQLQELKRKIVVVIDDVDRLTASEIRQVFQLVKISARFPYVIYLLAFDRTAVASALEVVGVGSGEEYLEKIVQVSFDLPPISESALTTMILNSISELVDKYGPAKMDTTRFGNVFHSGIRDSFDSLRDVQRFLNGLEFGFGIVAKEVNGVDFIGLECLRIFHPPIFAAVRNNKKIFAGTIDAFEKDRGAAEYRKTVEELFADKVSLEKTKDLLIELFPKLRFAYGNTLYGGEAETDWERELRIASTRYFDLYFQLVVSPDDVSTSDIEKLVSKASDWTALEELLEGYIGSKRIVNVLSSFRHSFEGIKPEFLPNVLRVLFDIGDKVGQSGSPLFGALPEFWHVRWAILDVLDRLPADARVNAVTETFRVSTGIATMIDFVRTLDEISQKRSDRYPEFTNDVREDLKKIAAGRIPNLRREELLANESLPAILFAWKNWANAQGLDSFVQDVLSDPRNFIAVLNRFIYQTHSASASDRVAKTTNRVAFKGLSEFVNLNEVAEKLRLIDASSLSNAERDVLILVSSQLDELQKSGLTPEQFDNRRTFD